MSVTSESTWPLEYQEAQLLQKLASLKLCAGNDVKIAARERELADLREQMAEQRRAA